MNRRQVLTTVVAFTGVSALSAVSQKKSEPFIYSLNMSTLRGHQLGFKKELEVAAKAGYKSVEIWVSTLQDFLKSGGTLQEASLIVKDLGITIEGAIGFAPWIIDDQGARIKGLEQMKAEMDQLAAIGCKRIATPPMGATTGPLLELAAVTERYRKVLELGDQTGVVPHLELWGFSKNLSRVGELLYIATEVDHPAARVLMDVYHLHKGGSGFSSVKNVGKPLIEVFHVNDYPAAPTRENITDADRVYVGDGVAPLKPLFTSLKNPEYPVVLSFEVFNKNYYAQDPLLVAKTSLEKLKNAVKGA
jgi:2-keto-myo-inositol isomerase